MADVVREETDTNTGRTLREQVIVPTAFEESFIRRIPDQIAIDESVPIILVGGIQGTDIQLAVFEGKPEPNGDWSVCNLVADRASPGGAVTCSRPGSTGLGVVYGGDWPDNLVWGPVPESTSYVELVVDGSPPLIQTPVAFHSLFITPLDADMVLNLRALDEHRIVTKETTFRVP